MTKKDQRRKAGPRVIPAHWRAPEVGTAAPAPSSSPATWPLGPCWASRIDHVGSQGVFLSRRRPLGSLSMVDAVINEERGLVDGYGDHAIGRSRLEKAAALLSGPIVGRAYPVPPEYVRFRVRQGEEISERRGVPLPQDFLTWQHLLEGVDDTWDPDFAGLEAERHRPALLEKTGILMCAGEFMDWWFSAQGRSDVRAFVDAVDAALAAFPGEGYTAAAALSAPPADLSLLSETHYLTVLWPLTAAATQAVEHLVDTHAPRIFPRERVERYHQRLQHMAYLTGLAGQPNLSALIATAAWGLAPERDLPPAQHPFLRALLLKTVEHHVSGDDEGQ